MFGINPRAHDFDTVRQTYTQTEATITKLFGVEGWILHDIDSKQTHSANNGILSQIH